MKVVTEKHAGYPSAKRGWYVANSGDYDIAGPFVHRHQAVAYVEARQPPVRCQRTQVVSRALEEAVLWVEEMVANTIR